MPDSKCGPLKDIEHSGPINDLFLIRTCIRKRSLTPEEANLICQKGVSALWLKSESSEERLKRKVRRLKYSLILTIIILTILVSGCFTSNNEDNITNNTENNYYKYSILIQTEENGEFELYVPIPYNPFINFSNIKNSFQTNLIANIENVSFELIDTIHGISLFITGSEDVEIISESIGGEYFGLILSMDVNETDLKPNNRNHWIYFNSTHINEINVNIKVINEAKDLGGGRSEKTSPEFQPITNGWNVITTRENVWNY